MPITRPFGDIEYMFDDALFAVPTRTTMDLPVDMYEGRRNITIEVLVPGIKPEDLSVAVDGKTLVIAGKREVVRKKETNAFSSQEITRGTVRRTVRLPSAVDEQHVQAWCDKGVLYLALPKRA